MFFLPPYAWLESYGRHGSFGTNISGSLSFSPVPVVTMVDACAAPQGGSTCFDPVRGVGRREKNKFT